MTSVNITILIICVTILGIFLIGCIWDCIDKQLISPVDIDIQAEMQRLQLQINELAEKIEKRKGKGEKKK